MIYPQWDWVQSYLTSCKTERNVPFASLNLAERNYSQIDKKALGLVWGVKKFHQYLYGRHFTLITAHQPLTTILNHEKGIPAMTAARMQCYALFLAAHNYSIEFRGTKKLCLPKPLTWQHTPMWMITNLSGFQT